MQKGPAISDEPLIMLSDDVAKKPILGLDRFAETIVRMVKGSDPKLSIGIYGEWGSGKTTLMRLVETKLTKSEKILCVWFNAWRYEREEQFAIIALLKTIGYAMGEHDIYKKLKPLLLNSVKLIAKGFFSEIA